jgi:hypothetical protein
MEKIVWLSKLNQKDKMVWNTDTAVTFWKNPAASICRVCDVGSRVLQYGGSHLQNCMTSYPRRRQFLHRFLPLFREGITALELKICVFWDVMLCRWLSSLLNFEGL